MINLKKIVAVTLAAAMCMGMGTVAFATDTTGYVANGATTVGTADDGPSTMGNVINSSYLKSNPQITVTPNDGKGGPNPDIKINRNILPTTEDSFDLNSEVQAILDENGITLPKGTQVIPIDYICVTDVSDTMANQLTIALPKTEFSTDPYTNNKYHPGDEILVMMETDLGSGVWEIRPYTINDAGEIELTDVHEGTVIVLKTMKNGRIVQYIQDDEGNDLVPPTIVEPGDNGTMEPVEPTEPSGSQGASAGAALGTSPKTGEF